jgi:predicted secreted protein with PEFG-CTERM motif
MLSSNSRAYALVLLLIGSLISTAFVAVPKSFASHEDITVEIEDIVYDQGDEVVIEGIVDGADDDEEVEITVEGPDGSDSEDVTIEDEEYSFTYELGNNADEGLYVVQVSFGSDDVFSYFKVVEDDDDDPITVETEDDLYAAGDTVEITGFIQDPELGEDEVDIEVIGPDNSRTYDNTVDLDGDEFSDDDFDLDDDADHGRYAVIVSYAGDEAVTIFEVEDEDAGNGSSEPITVKTDKTTYEAGDTVRITGEVDVVSGEDQVDIVIIGPDNDEVVDDEADVESDGEFSFSFDLDDEAEDGKYRVIITYDNEDKEISFNIGSTTGSSVLTVKLDKSGYLTGETMKVSGKVDRIIKDQTVNILVFKPDSNFAGLAAYVEPNADLTYSADIRLIGNLDVKSDYTVKVSYGDNDTEIEFDITGQSANSGTITVKTDKTEYSAGSTVKITGTVNTDLLAAGQSVVIQVNNPNGDAYRVDLITPSSDGSYSYDMVVGGKLGVAGEYDVTATYNLKQAKTTFELKGKLTANLKVDGSTFPIEYEISNGSVKSVFAKPDDDKLAVSVDGTQAGRLTIVLPRNVIDAVEDGQDIRYMVTTTDLESGEEDEITVVEAQTGSTSRTLVIDYPQGTDLIEIQGTQVVPEFGVIAALILAASLVAVIGFARFRGSSLGFGRF